MTNLSQRNCEPCLSERVTGALAVALFGAIVAGNTASVVLTLLGA